MSGLAAADAPVRARRIVERLLRPGWARLGIIALLLLLWEAGVRLFGNPLFLSPPSHVAVALVRMAGSKPVLAALATTFGELVLAFILSVAIGLPIGLVVGLHRFSRAAFLPIVLLLYAVPQATILPLFILAFGIGPEAKIAFGVSHGMFPIMVTVAAGVQNLPPILLTAARSMGASRRQVLVSIVLPHMIPSVFTGMRLAMAAVLLGVLLAELYVSQAGVGYYTRLFTESFEPQNLFAIIAALAAIAVTLNELCRWAERRATRWHG